MGLLGGVWRRMGACGLPKPTSDTVDLCCLAHRAACNHQYKTTARRGREWSLEPLCCFGLTYLLCLTHVGKIQFSSQKPGSSQVYLESRECNAASRLQVISLNYWLAIAGLGAGAKQPLAVLYHRTSTWLNFSFILGSAAYSQGELGQNKPMEVFWILWDPHTGQHLYLSSPPSAVLCGGKWYKRSSTHKLSAKN